MEPKGNNMAGDELVEALKPFAEAADRFDEAAAHFKAPLPDDALRPKTEFTHGDLRRARAALARLSRSTSTEAGRLPFVVKYRRTDGVAWIAMAAFDQEGPAERYCAWCAAESSPWEYCVVEDDPSLQGGAEPAEDDWDGLDCACGGGWKVGHLAGCPEADTHSLVETGGAETGELVEARLAAYRATVDRVWHALGVATYDDAGGREISEIVADYKSRAESAESSLAAEKLRADQHQENAVEAQIRAFKWMEAHDKLAAGKPYDYPKTADMPEAIARSEALEQRVAALVGALKPFGADAQNWADTVPDDYAPRCTEPGKTYTHPGSEASFTVGDIRRAALATEA